MESNRLILASASPRRRELLQEAGYLFEIDPAQKEENRYDFLTGEAKTEALARDKALEVLARHKDCVVLGSDTLVLLEGECLGKPKNEADAAKMLEKLAGRSHRVCTSVCVAREGRVSSFRQVAEVTFRPLSQKEILDYVATGEPMDKAGAYGIQGKAAKFVSRIEGDYTAIVGLPVCRTCQLLQAFGIIPKE